MSFPPHSTSALHSTMFLLIQHIWSINFASSNFTFHDVSINTIPYASSFSVYCPLHSTMFLLIPPLKIPQVLFHCSLHSTMFLLIPPLKIPQVLFHCSLHSTMFLLIRCLISSLNFLRWVFTFHDVSINTMCSCKEKERATAFTFHDVSINTRVFWWKYFLSNFFTFHDVSINT